MRPSAAILFKWRIQSHYWDWLDALERAFDARLIDVHRAPPVEPIYNADFVIIHHSVYGGEGELPEWAISALSKRRGRLLLFLTNEFRDFHERAQLAERLGVDFLITQMPLESAFLKYGAGSYKLVEMPLALNHRSFTKRVQWSERPFSFGYRGVRYPAPEIIGDQDKNVMIHGASLMAGFGVSSDVKWGKEEFGYREWWAQKLNCWCTTASVEAGGVGAKMITARHFDAIGCGTLQVMPVGNFNGILLPNEHYVPVELKLETLSAEEFNPLYGAIIRALDEEKMADRAREYICDTNTYDHRTAQLLEAIGAH